MLDDHSPTMPLSPQNSAPPIDWTIDDALDATKSSCGDILTSVKRLLLLLWGRTSRKIRTVGGIIIFTLITLSLWRPSTSGLPSVYLEYNHNNNGSPFNASRVALLIENRPNPILAPLILHFMAVVPPEWRFRFMGSDESIASLNQSHAIRDQVRIGKLDLTHIPSNMTTGSQEEISRFLTTRWLYETLLQPAEHLLVFQTDSMLCANSQQSLNEWLDFDWVGAPWHPEGKWGGNGGLSLRKVSAILDILRNQVRAHGTAPEDVWLAERLALRPGAKMANGTASLTFSGEMHGGAATVVTVGSGKKAPDGERERRPAGGGIDSDATAAEVADVDLWRDGFYEPMGYHTGDNGRTLHRGIWGTPEMRRHIWDYCPEVKMIFEMDAAEYVPGSCNTNWKRGIDDGDVAGASYDEMEERGVRRSWDPDNVDEFGYPYLPAGLMGW